MSRSLSCLLFAVLLVACAPEPRLTALDQCHREQLFKACMAALPAGPNSTVSNDWAEVVQTCDDTARMQSYRPRRFVPLQCRANP